jgi:hypothetical protein
VGLVLYTSRDGERVLGAAYSSAVPRRSDVRRADVAVDQKSLSISYRAEARCRHESLLPPNSRDITVP